MKVRTLLFYILTLQLCCLCSCRLYRDTFQRSNDITPLDNRSLAPEIVVAPQDSNTPRPEDKISNYENALNYEVDKIIGDLKQGDDYKIDDPVTYDGLNYYFIINSKFGKFEAYGLDELNERLAELPAIARLYKISTLEHVGIKAGEGIIQPFEAAGHLVLNPISSAEQVPEAIQSLYDKAADFIERAGHTGKKAYDVVIGPSDEEIAKKKEREELEQKKAAEQTKEKKSANSDDNQNRSQKKEELSIQATEYAKDYTDDYVGYASAKRELAKSVEVDPYSSNPFVQRELVRLARWQSAGRITMKLVPLPSVPYVGLSAKVDSILWNSDERGLVEQSFKQLIKLNIPAVTVRKLLANNQFTRSQLTQLSTYLSELEGVTGLPDFAALLANTETPSVAHFYINVTKIFIKLHKKHGIKSLSTSIGVPLAISKQASVIIVAPFDRISWIECIDKYVSAVKKWAASNKLRVKLIHLGSISQKAQSKLKAQKIILGKISLE